MDALVFSKVLDDMLTILVRGAIIGLVLVVGLILTISWLVFSEPNWQTEAIERGYALHCPTTGEFAWKGECDN